MDCGTATYSVEEHTAQNLAPLAENVAEGDGDVVVVRDGVSVTVIVRDLEEDAEKVAVTDSDGEKEGVTVGDAEKEDITDSEGDAEQEGLARGGRIQRIDDITTT